jgi:hypothetical protein
MKKLESLNNSLFEKFENKRVNNIAAIIAGNVAPNWVITQCGNGSDEFTVAGGSGMTNSHTMYIKDLPYRGDICYN